ncbi:DUF3253 domain-containing protein [Nocardioides deserti]|uniref:DUF3253 domain-containing protein n=1 Tax=Nocardioides deserti TaxID=1588644 RepID=A0ABR6UBA4_9ACTN|nr:DUF3253 domain-containing protein [Nocardioides deserti]MBC2961633.1 DUF3253 domain-containing protein [Nocardioides deserti]GGO76821.1 hypothetical protein GCM10012276_30480 [Nocardioides deserti]
MSGPAGGGSGGAGDRVDEVGARLERTILDLLAQREEGKTICPSDAARAVGTEQGWRDLMEPARQAAQRLVEAGEVEVTQCGAVVDLPTARGPVRIRKRPPQR